MLMLFSKIFSYACNAYLDAQIAEELVCFLRSNSKQFATKNTVARERAEKLVMGLPKTILQQDPSFVIGLAYTQYYLNGLADILYTELLWPLVISKEKKNYQVIYTKEITKFRKQFPTRYQYEEFMNNRSFVFTYWPLLIVDPWRWASAFAKNRCEFTGPVSRASLQKAALAVQDQNRENNRAIAEILINKIPSDDPKVIAIRAISHALQNDTIILHAAETQRSAAKWDSLFVWMIHRYA